MIDLDNLITQAGIKDVATTIALRAVINEIKELRQVTSKMKYFRSPTMPEGMVLSTSLGIDTDLPTQTTKEFLKDQDYGLDVKEFIQGKPAVGKWYQSATIVGAGSYTWDTEVFNEKLFFTRITANTQIQFNKPGKYLIITQVAIFAPAGINFTVTLYLNGVAVRTSYSTAGAGVNRSVNPVDILDIKHGDYIEMKNSAGDRLGEADGESSFVAIYHLN